MIVVLATIGVVLTLLLAACLAVALFAVLAWALGGIFWAVMDRLP